MYASPMRLALLLVIATTAVAHGGRDVVVLIDDPPGLAAAAVPPRALYLNRCVGGCTVTPGDNSARDDRSSIIDQTYTLSEFAYDDATWDAVVACIRAAWAPYDLDVVTEEPDGIPYNEIMIAGSPGELGQDSNTLGLAPMSSSCTPNSDWIAFAFANAHGSDPVESLCDTAAHEPGHILGLDHEYDCKDKMTYLTGCSEKWFLNVSAPCGEFENDGPRDCQCTGATQNSHAILTDLLGAGEPPPPPTVEVIYPLDGAAVIPSFTMFGKVTEPRITDHVEFWINGWPWGRAPGVREGDTYSYQPTGLPDGYLDLEVRAYNDLNLVGVSPTITVLKGEPCTSADSCLDGQFCEDGRCAWPPPTGELGDECGIDADCITRKCGTDGEVNLCTSYCQLGVDGECGDGYACLRAGDDGLCWPSDRIDAGCCSASGGGAGSAALALVFIAGTGRRRSARRSRS